VAAAPRASNGTSDSKADSYRLTANAADAKQFSIEPRSDKSNYLFS
jgi:hypothetical protein